MTTVISPQIDSQYVLIALDYLETGDRELLSQIAETGGARHITTHARRVSISGDAPTARELVEQVLTSESIADIDPEQIRARLSMMETNRRAQLRCWNEAAAYLPIGALTDSTLFLTIGYDIGVAVSGNASLNLAHPHFALNPEELWYYGVHEIHHAGYQKYGDLPILADIKTTKDLVDLIKYLTTMEGLAVHAARRWRTEVGAMESDPDYAALLDPERMDMYENEFFTLYRDLAATRSRPIKNGDWDTLERMSNGDRLWYRVGARMAYRIEKALGRETLIDTIVGRTGAFFDRYAEIVT